LRFFSEKQKQTLHILATNNKRNLAATMKNFPLLFPALLLTTFINAQSCCQKPDGMALFATNAKFIASHENPIPFNFQPDKGKMITFKAGDKEGNAYAVLSGKKTDKVVLMFHEWWGLNDYIKKEAESLQKELGDGVDVYAVDLYDGQVATEREKASALMSGLKPERASAIINGLLANIGKDKKVATIGWCMGGSWSLQATLLAFRQAACVMYYGFPEKDPEKLKGLKTDILFLQAMQDGFITPSVVTQFSEDIKKLGKSITIKQYNADHAFANPSNPKFNKEFAADAHKLALAFLKKGLGVE